jgi:lysophospholipase L1-like esterase
MTQAGAGGGAPDGGADAEMAAPDRVPPCIDDPNDVVLIGDSYIDWITHTFVADIRAESGQAWPSYAIGGTSMATGGIGHIPDQLDTALAANPEIKAVVMTGGGNDILVADTFMFPDAGMCTSTPNAPMIEDCRAIVQAALDSAAALMVETADAGIRDVVYFFYPHIPGGGLISGPTPNPILDYALPRAREVCESALERTSGRMKCHFIDMVPVFEGKTGLFADVLSEAGDGVHPNSMGSKEMAREVWRVMQAECIAQPSGSGCCESP